MNKMKIENNRYVIVRTYSAGVFAGNLESTKKDKVTLRNARRIYYWEGASTLSELATNGTSKPERCMFPIEVDRITLFGVIEISDVTERAEKSIKGVKIWTQF
jgi:hypothetical protein